MDINLFENRDVVAKDLIAFLRLRGYSRLSLSKLSGIPRPEIDLLLNSECADPNLYHDQIKQIIKTFDLPIDYFLITRSNIEPPTEDNLYKDQRSPKATELLQGLENVLDVYSLYLD